MPAEDRQNITMTPEQRNHGERIARRKVDGFAFKRADGEINWSAVARYAMALAARKPKLEVAPKVSPAPAQPSGAKPDAVRLSEAIGKSGLTLRKVADAAGCGHHTTVSRVLAGHLELSKAGGGALLAWVEGVERG